MSQQQKEINDGINNLKLIREAMGVDAIVGPTNTLAYKKQADIVLEDQGGIDDDVIGGIADTQG